MVHLIVFKKQIGQVMSGSHAAKNISDDIIIWEKQTVIMINIFYKVLQQIRDSGLKLNPIKCVFVSIKLDLEAMYYPKMVFYQVPIKLPQFKTYKLQHQSRMSQILFKYNQFLPLFYPKLFSSHCVIKKPNIKGYCI